MKSRLLSYKNDNSSGLSSNFKLLEEDDEGLETSKKVLHKSHNVFQTRVIENTEPNISQLP